jgi:ribulose-phosphate 3-epimerase
MPGRGAPRDGGAAEPDAPRAAATRIAANILAADLACLGHEVAVAVRSGADRVHVDVMEFGAAGVSIAPLVCRALKRVARAPLEVHLLVKPCERLVAAFAEAGADLVLFHPEASEDVRRTGAAVRKHGCAVGLAVAAGAPLDALDGLLDGIDVVLVTGAAPASGRRLAPATLRWIRALRERVSALRPRVTISVEGGIDAESGAALAAAGADELVVESARCRSADHAANIAALRRALTERGLRAGDAARPRTGELAS